MSEPIQYCLLISRAGKTHIFPLQREMRFGYAPPHPSDLVLYDGALRDVHGIIEHDPSAPQDTVAKEGGRILTQFRLRAQGSESPEMQVAVNNAQLPPRRTISVQLRTGDQIQVGRKYLLTVSQYEATNGVVSTRRVGPEASLAEPLWKAPRKPPYLNTSSALFMKYLPEIYQASEDKSVTPSFLDNFLALLESVYIPTKWTVENLDLLLHPNTAPLEFLPWLALWYGYPLHADKLSEAEQRALLAQIPKLIAHKGTAGGLRNLLCLYTGQQPEIDDYTSDEHTSCSQTPEPHKYDGSFTVTFDPIPEQWTRAQLLALIDQFKPAHTRCILLPQDGWCES